MPAEKENIPQPRSPRRPGEVLAIAATALAAALALNAPAMLRSAGKLPFDSPTRAPALRALAPAADISAKLRLDRLRAALEAAERRLLEPPPPAFPEPADDETTDPDDNLDDFLF